MVEIQSSKVCSNTIFLNLYYDLWWFTWRHWKHTDRNVDLLHHRCLFRTTTNRRDSYTWCSINHTRSFCQVECWLFLFNFFFFLTDTSGKPPSNVFWEVLTPTRHHSRNPNPLQLELHYASQVDHTRATVLLNNMRVMCVMDLLLAAKDFLLEYDAKSVQAGQVSFFFHRKFHDLRHSCSVQFVKFRIHKTKPNQINNSVLVCSE